MAFVIITPALTGHTYYKSPYESYDDCGTCDGARCETCREMYEVYDAADVESDRYKIVATKEEAEQIKELWEKS